MAERTSPRRFAVCIRNKGYEASLERNKIYLVRPEPRAEKDGDIRIFDESGEDYLYPAEWFVAVEVPKAAHASLMKASLGPGRLTLIQGMEDEIDVRKAKAARSEMKRKGLKPIPYEQVRKRLGLKC